MKRLHDEHVKETSEGNTPIHLVQRTRQRREHQLKDLKNMIIKSMPKQDGENILRSHGKLVTESNTFVLVKSVGPTR